MAKERWKLTDEQWKKIEKFLPRPRVSKKGGRPWADNRRVFEGILWVRGTTPSAKYSHVLPVAQPPLVFRQIRPGLIHNLVELLVSAVKP